MGNEQKSKIHLMKLNSMSVSDDPTQLKCTFAILDFNVSNNNEFISEEDAMEILAPTILNKPIVAKYNKVWSANDGTDHFEGHNQYLTEDRDGDKTIEVDTTPMGVFVSEGYVIEIDGVRTLVADAILWRDRFSDACDLLLEWYGRGVNINTSCEFLYKNYTVVDGITQIQNPIYFSGHCILNSEERGGQDVVLPAYDSSKLLSFNELNKFNRLVAQAVDQESKEEINGMEFMKKLNEISYEQLRSLLHKDFNEKLEKGAYSYIQDVYETYFIVNEYKWSDEEDDYSYDKYYKVGYSKGENDTISIDYDSKVEVVVKRDWVEVSEFQTIQNELSTTKATVETLTTQLNELKVNKEDIEAKFNSASETILSLNSQVEELTPLKEQLEKEHFEKALNEKKEYYSSKFEALGAKEKFESEEVQTLINQVASNDENTDKAILQLNSMLVDMVVLETKFNSKETTITEVASGRKDLLPTANDFESTYSL